MSSRAGRQFRLRRALAAARDRRDQPELVGILADSSARVLVVTRARGLARRDRRRVVPDEADFEAVVLEHAAQVEVATGRPTAVFHRHERAMTP